MKHTTISLSHLIIAGLLCALVGGAAVAQPVSAQVQNTAQMSERDQQLMSMIERLQEMIIMLQRKLTTIHGQKAGQNLINENSIAETNEFVTLYEEASFESEPVAQHPAGEWGEVSAGPKLVGGEVWWRFDFRDETSGWSPESKFTRTPSTVISIDTNQDGISDTRFRLIGEYDSAGFVVEPSDEGTIIRYQGEVVEPYDIIEN